jgi:hypothetical protein
MDMKPVQCKNCKHFVRDIFYKYKGICSNGGRYTREHRVCNLLDTELYTVHVICWDGVEYTREATKDEIDAWRKNGYVKEDGYSGITFDFRSSHGE